MVGIIANKPAKKAAKVNVRGGLGIKGIEFNEDDAELSGSMFDKKSGFELRKSTAGKKKEKKKGCC